MARQYQISGTGINNVVGNTYIHSHAFYFRSVLGQLNINTKELEKNFKDVDSKINKLIRSSTQAEENFYGKVSSTTKTPIRNFSDFQKYISKTTSKEKDIINKLNQPEVKDMIIAEARPEFGKWLNESLKGKEIKKILSEALEKTEKDLVDAIIDSFYSSFGKGKDLGLGEGKDLGLGYKRLKQELSTKRRKEIEKALTDMAAEPGADGQITLISEIFQTVLPKVENKENHSLFTKEEIKIILDTLKSKSIDFGFSVYQLGDTSNVVGLIGELNFAILFRNFSKELKHQGTKLDKTSKQDIRDFLWDGFGIQVKNVKNPNIKIQDSITIDGLIDKMTAGDQNEKMKYLIGNMIYFREMGNMPSLEKSSKTNQNWGMPIAEQKQLESFVYLFLNYYSDILFQAEIDEQEGYNIKNVFYFYQNKYLIPMSNFFKAIKESIREIKENSERKQDVFLGGIRRSIGYAPGGNLLGLNYEQFWQEKKEQEKPPGALDYPQNLVSIGSNLGKNITKSSKAKVNFFVNINSIMKNIV